MTEPIRELDRAGLRNFGLTMGGIVAILFGLVIPWLFETRFPIWPWVVGAAFVGWGMIAPSSMRSFYIAWMRLALLLNRVVSPVVLGVVFFVVVTPMGLVMRLLGKNPLVRAQGNDPGSYRIHCKTKDPTHFERPY